MSRRGNNSAHSVQRRHMSYLSFSNLLACYLTEDLTSQFNTTCEFVTTVETCDMINIVDYLDVLFCTMNLSPELFGLIMTIIIMLGLVLIMCTYVFILSKYFVLPNVLHVAEYMKIPLYNYGLAIVAVIITGPDIIWVFHDCTEVSKNSSLLLAELIGSVFGSLTIGIGVISVCCFNFIPGWRTIVEMSASTVALAVTYLTLQQKLESDVKMTASEWDLYPLAFGLLSIYVMYIGYIIATGYTNVRRKSDGRLSRFSNSDEKTTGWTQLTYALNPFNHIKIRSRWIVYILLPLWMLAALQVPVVDNNRNMYGWSKYLACVNFFIFPIAMHFGFSYAFFFFSMLTFSVCFVLIILTVFFTKPQSAPRMLGLYSSLGMLIAIFVISIVEGEIETIIWQTLSFVFNSPFDITILIGYSLRNLITLAVLASDFISLGLADLACGVVVGVIISRVFMLMPILAFQSCFDYDRPLAVSASTKTCYTFLMISFVLTVFTIPILNFKLRKSFGIFIFIVFSIYNLFLLLEGLWIIHPMGAFHSIGGEMKEHVSWA